MRGKVEKVWAAPGFELGRDPFTAVWKIKGEVFRQAPGRITLRFEREGRSYFLKRHEGVGWMEIAKNLLSLRLPIVSAKNEWLAIRYLERHGVPTMKPMAYGCLGNNPASLKSYIITEELAPTESLEDVVSDWEQSPPEVCLKRQLLLEVARMTRNMHAAGINHRDLYICHFLLHTDLLYEDKVKLSLIDLHRAQLRSSVPERWRNKDLAALYFSALPANLGRRDILRFLKVYFDGSLREILNREARRLNWIQREGERLRIKFYRKYAVDE